MRLTSARPVSWICFGVDSGRRREVAHEVRVVGRAIGQCRRRDRLPRTRTVFIVEKCLELRVRRYHAICDRGTAGRRQSRPICLRHGRRELREWNPEGRVFGTRVLGTCDDARNAGENFGGKHESLLHALAHVRDVLAEVARHVAEARDVVVVVAGRSWRLLVVQLKQVGVEAAVAVERSAPLAVLPELEALIHHEVEQVVADGIEIGERAPIDLPQSAQELAIGLEPPRLVGRGNRRQAVVEFMDAVVRRSERVFPPSEGALVGKQLPELRFCVACRGFLRREEPEREHRDRRHKFHRAIPLSDLLTEPCQSPGKSFRDQRLSFTQGCSSGHFCPIAC